MNYHYSIIFSYSHTKKHIFSIFSLTHEVLFFFNFFFRSFPVATYQPLLDAFLLVLRSGRSVASATSSFQCILQDMAKRDENAFLLEEKKYQNIVRKREAKEREVVRKEKEEKKEKEEEEEREEEMMRMRERNVEKEVAKEGEKEGERKEEIHDSKSIENNNDKGTGKTKYDNAPKVNDTENNGISDEEVDEKVEVEVEVEEEEVEIEVESEIEEWGSVEILPWEEKDYLRKTGITDSVILLKHGKSFTEYSYPEIDLIDEIPNNDFNNTSYKIKYNKDSNKDEILNDYNNNNNNNNNNDNNNNNNKNDNNNNNINNNNKSNSGKFRFLVNTSNKFRSKNNSEKSNKTNSGKYKNKSGKKNNNETEKTVNTENTENTENENININEFSRRRSMSESYFMENQSKQALVPLHLKTFSYMHTHLLGELLCYCCCY